MAKFKAPKVANNAKAIPVAPALPQRGERTAKNYAKQERKNGPGGEPRHPQSHDEFEKLGQ